jgi:hypothetical protein
LDSPLLICIPILYPRTAKSQLFLYQLFCGTIGSLGWKQCRGQSQNTKNQVALPSPAKGSDAFSGPALGHSDPRLLWGAFYNFAPS